MAIPLETIIGDKIPHPLRQYYIISWAHNTKLSLSLPMDAMHFLQSKKKMGQQVERGNQYQDLQKAVYLEAGLPKTESIQRLDWLRLSGYSWIMSYEAKQS